jgi:branched-chain amino acid transport system substrate-binding protein
MAQALRCSLCAFLLIVVTAPLFVVRAVDTVRIGFGIALTGGLAVNGRPALLAMQIWAEDINARGGLLGRKVELVYYDDQSDPSVVPALYSKLLDVDKVDLIISGYGTNMVAPAMPTVIERQVMCFSLFALAVNEEFHYPRYFSMVPFGPRPKLAISKGFFNVAMARSPTPRTLAIVAADAEFASKVADGARENAKVAGLKVVYDRTYPPKTVEFASILRAVQAAKPDLIYVGSYPPDSTGLVRAAHEIGLQVQAFGGSMVGLQATTIRAHLGPLLNGIIYGDSWVPVPALMFGGTAAFLARYQARAGAAGVDPLGYFTPPFAYARMQALAQAIEATGGLDQGKLADWLHLNAVRTVVGDIRFNADGEWSQDRALTVQFQGIKNNGIDQFRDSGTQVVLDPIEYRSGTVIWPFARAHQ